MDEQSDRAKLAEITQRQRQLQAALGKPTTETAVPPPVLSIWVATAWGASSIAAP